MTIRKVLVFPDPRLRTKAEKIHEVTDETRTLIDDMLETMYEHNGVGLAATQINEHKRIIVIDTSEAQDQPIVLINPEILKEEAFHEGKEGCISFPGIFENTTRATKITFAATNRDGEPYEMDAEGLLAWCVQHEIDHLDGKLLIDFLSPLKKSRVLKKLQKIKKLMM